MKRKTEIWLMQSGWESNGVVGAHQRWRKRSFDKNNQWMPLSEAIKEQRKFEKFWNKK